MMAFIWLALVYVILAFTDITASTFVGRTEDLAGMAVAFNQGGAVALASVLYLLLSVVMGFVERYLRPPLWLTTLVFVPATLGCVWLGTRSRPLLVLDGAHLGRHHPRVLLRGLADAGVGAAAAARLPGRASSSTWRSRWASSGSSSAAIAIPQPAFKGWTAPGATGALFPFLFVTIACGACSGFHGLVCSGTTSKQIARETHCRPVGYGAMLLEGFVALIALSTVMIASDAAIAGKGPGLVYAQGPGPLPGRDHRRGEPALRHDVRGHGVLHLHLRHPRRLHAPGPLHPAGADGLEQPRDGASAPPR